MQIVSEMNLRAQIPNVYKELKDVTESMNAETTVMKEIALVNE